MKEERTKENERRSYDIDSERKVNTSRWNQSKRGREVEKEI